MRTRLFSPIQVGKQVESSFYPHRCARVHGLGIRDAYKASHMAVPSIREHVSECKLCSFSSFFKRSFILKYLRT